VDFLHFIFLNPFWDTDHAQGTVSRLESRGSLRHIDDLDSTTQLGRFGPLEGVIRPARAFGDILTCTGRIQAASGASWNLLLASSVRSVAS
jgi:hypothetical protein